MPYLQTLPDGSLLIKVYVQPRASRNEVVGMHDDSLKIRLTSPPVDGQANKAVIAFLAKCLNLPKSAVSIRSGHQNRNKQILVENCNEEYARQLFLEMTE